MKQNGTIIAGIGGNYDVQLDDGQRVRCKARGIFRKQKTTPLIGDRVTISKENFLESIAPRKNALIRPAAANIDQVLVVFAVHNPEPHFMLLDRFLLEAGRQKIPVAIILNKMDLWEESQQRELTDAIKAYEKAGYPVYQVSTYDTDEVVMEKLREQLQD
ncbi:MAG: GTPase RsgA, partial [Firmicutes bacterium]|nr:GTPase RsgA [Bacillota bacterium]